MTSALVWRPRISRKKRAAALATVQRIYPGSTDGGDAIQVPSADCGVCWLFLLGSKLFRDIRAESAP